MADVHLDRLVAEFTLDHSKLIENAEQSEEILQQLGQAVAENKKQQQNSNLVIARAAKELKALQRQTEENGKADEEQENKIAQLNRVIDEEKAKIERLKREQEQLQQALGDTSESTEQLGENSENLNKTFSSMTVAVGNLISQGINLLISKLGDLAKDVIQTGESFTSSMSEVQAISGATAEQLEILEQTARKYGASTKFSATEAADALKYMALAGWDVQQSTAALGGILNLAAASGMELAKSSDMVTDYLSAFGMAANQSAYFADLLTYAQGNSNTSAEQLGEAYRNCAANLNAAGQDVETVTSFLEAMANQGKKGSEAGTAMAAIVRDITNKMEDGKIKIGETSIAVQDAAGNFGDLTDILVEVEKATNNMGTAEKAAALSATFTADSINGINLILNEGMDKVSGYEKALRNSTGAAADAAKVMSDNLLGDLKNLESAFDELKLKLYDSAETPLRNLVKLIQNEGVAALDGIIKNLKTVIPVIVGAATAMATLKANMAMSAAIEKLISGFNGLTIAEIAAKVAAEGLKGALESIKAHPVVAVLSLLTTAASIIATIAVMNSNNAESTDKLTASTKQYCQALAEVESNATKNKENGESEIALLETLKRQYDDLRNKTNLTSEEKRTLKYTAEELAKTLGVSVESLQNESGAYKDLTSDVDEYIQKLRESIFLESNKEGYTAAYKDYNEAMNDLQNVSDKMEEIKAKMKNIGFEDKMKELGSAFASGKISLSQYNEAQKQLYESFGETEESVEHLQTEYYNTLNATMQAANGVARYEKALGSARDENELFEELMGDFIEKTDDSSKAQEDHARKVQDNKTVIEELNKKITESTEKTEKLKTASENYQKESKTLQSSLSDLAGVHDKLNQGQKLDLDTILSLVDKYPEYASQLLKAADNADAQKQAIELLFEAKRQEYILTQQSAIDNIKASNDVTEQIIGDVKKQIEAYKNLIEVQKNVSSGFFQVNDGKFKPVQTEEGSFDSLFKKPWEVDGLDEKIKSAQEMLNTLERQVRSNNRQIGEYEEKIQALQSIDIGTFKITNSGNGSSKNTDDEIKKQNEERLNSYLKDLEHLKAMDQLTIQEEIAGYQKILDEFVLTSDQRKSVEEKLYSATKKLREQEETAQENAVQKEYERIDRLAKQGYLSTQQEIAQLEKIAVKYKLTTEQKITLEDKLYEKKKQLRDEEISSLDNLGNAVVTALKNRYEQQKELEEKRIDESIENWKKWEDETVGAIQGQIDALDELKNAHDEENKRQEYENKRQALELQAAYEKDDYNRQQIQKQIAALDKEENERLFNVQIEEQKKALQAQADNIKAISAENQERLQNQKNTISETYGNLMNDIALQGEAKKFILENTQDEIVKLINSYAEDYEMLGQSLGERLYSGMTSKVDDINAYINTVAQRTDTAGERTVAANRLNAYIKSVADTVNQISANAAALKNQMAVTANAAADRYYEVQKQYYNTSTNNNISKPVVINMTVNFNEKVNSPVEVRRQMESFSQQLAKEILSGSG